MKRLVRCKQLTWWLTGSTAHHYRQFSLSCRWGDRISRTLSLFIQLVLAIAALVIAGEQSSVGNRSALVVILFYI